MARCPLGPTPAIQARLRPHPGSSGPLSTKGFLQAKPTVWGCRPGGGREQGTPLARGLCYQGCDSQPGAPSP